MKDWTKEMAEAQLRDIKNEMNDETYQKIKKERKKLFNKRIQECYWDKF